MSAALVVLLVMVVVIVVVIIIIVVVMRRRNKDYARQQSAEGPAFMNTVYSGMWTMSPSTQASVPNFNFLEPFSKVVRQHLE